MAANTALLARFASRQSHLLQRKNPVDVSIVRAYQPMLDFSGSPSLKPEEWAEIRKNRENFVSLCKAMAGAVAKKSSQGMRNQLPISEMQSLLDYLAKQTGQPDFPLTGSKALDYLRWNEERTASWAKPVLQGADPYLAVEFLGNFRLELGALLEKSARVSYMDGRQASSLQFIAAYSLFKLFEDYLQRCKHIETVRSVNLELLHGVG